VTGVDEALRAQVEAWIADDVDPASMAQLRDLLARGDSADTDDGPAAGELADRFSGPLLFGTAGLRGPIRAGPNGMNRAVVRRAAAGLAAWLSESGGTRGRIVIGYDGRHLSKEFAQDSAAVFTAAGHEALLLPRLLPTPLLAFAVLHLQAQVGVMVTASHNPPADNGYKVYVGDGAQIVPPTDTEIEHAISAAPPARDVALDDSYLTLDESIVDSYVDAMAGLIGPGPREIAIAHTAMHGVGTAVIERVFRAAGFAPLHTVPEQAEPDPDFPTVAFPNPEEPGALDLALALAHNTGAQLLIANDPDADRCAVAAPDRSGAWRVLTGNEVGILLADWLIAKGVRGTYATTIVSSTMLRAMAARHGVGYAETLTGFKWISRAAPDLVFGYEEALGYAVAPTLVRDKDGISAALLIAERAAALLATGSSLLERLDELAAEYGRYGTDQTSIRVDDLSLIDTAMDRLRAAPPTTLLGQPVTCTDLAPVADVVTLSWSGGRVVVRPSGTEPKLKAYLEVVVADGSAKRAVQLLATLRGEVAELLTLTG
jgi:phosphomannomutase